MNREDITTKWNHIIEIHLGVEPNKITEEAHFEDDLGADSLDMVELVMAAEEEFNIEIPDAEAEKITTVKDSLDLIEHKTRENF